MSACCVSGCKNGHSSSSKLKLYRIPSGSGPVQANRRRLWLEAIHRANGSTDELKRNARICGAHFKSQEASIDHNSPDFVPSVFTCAKQRRPKKVKRVYSCRKSQRLASNVEEKTSPPRVDSPVDLQSSEEIQTPSVPQDGETLTEEPETETTPVKSQTFSPDKVSPSFNAPAGIPQLDKRSIIVLLKPIYVPASGYQCEQCNQSFTNTSQLMKHKKLHEEQISSICEKCGTFFSSQPDFTEHQCEPEPSFPCNMCDRSFTTSHKLKRHKLLHFKDGRKCPTCGVLFCQQHKHILFLPSAKTVTEYEEDPTIPEPQNVYSSLKPENPVPVKPETNQNPDLDPDARSNSTVLPGPLSKTHKTPADPDARSNSTVLPGPLSKTHKTPASQARTSSVINIPMFSKPPFVSSLPPPVPKVKRKPQKLSWFRPDCPASLDPPLLPQHSDLPPSLKLFSPLYLTSALLEVKRNYEYILSKPRGVDKIIVKEEQCEVPLISPD